MSSFRLAFLLVAGLALSAPAARAVDALVKPVPTPDLSRLPAEQAKDLREARASFDKARATLAGDRLAQVYAMMGAAYASNGFPEAADVALEDASLLAPKDGRWVYARGVLAQSQKHEAVAQNYFDIAFGLDKEYLPIRLAVARARLANGDVAGARQLMTEYVASHDDQPAAHALLGEIALRQGNAADAVKHYRRALALDPRATALYTPLAQAEERAGNASAAAEARAKAGPIQPALADPIATGLLGRAGAPGSAAKLDPVAAAAGRAAMLMAARQYDGARRELDGALRQQPGDSTLLALYARVEAAAGNLPAARTRAAAAIQADPRNALAHLSQAVAMEMAGDDSAARKAYERAVQEQPSLGEARLLLGELLLRTGDRDAAIAQFRALVQLNLRDPTAWMHLVAADVLAGRCAVALKDVNDVLAKDAGNAFVLQLFVRLASTCPAASAAERRGALEHGAKLYERQASAQVSEAYALALAANGRWDDAVKTQEAALFLLVRNGLKAALPPYREVLEQLKAHRLPDRPWPASAAVYHPTRLAPDPKS